MDTEKIYALISVIAFIVVFISFIKPVKSIIKFVFNSVMGIGAILVSNFLLEGIGISLGVNILNASVIGILGLPGLAALILINKIL
ncbi:MAG: pro-sigmaK processing inhibitor BofA family protein [Firmicutes bacterium]|nr:pro-sigmaK processing inhibitor BofA family protein [Bacillota bacterium]